MAISILRKFSACASSCDWNSILSSFERPSTSSATGLTETLGDLGLADRGVLHHVVQQRGDHPFDVHLPFGNGAGDGQRVRDVGFSRQALLTAMRLFTEQIRFADQRNFFRRQIEQAVDEDPVSRIVLGIRRLDGQLGQRYFFSRQACVSKRIADHVLRNRSSPVRPDRG
jgi:hypothetical protein